uniref:ATP synthase F1 complex delta/epsilon subunit N-terminal domain-containing protein n=1 Tax=Rhizochromulina marina TaxID=1034831 RepID=A0A7S2REG8_9STRA|mmetsp:Transcript_19232/g.40392  ORF Transcript_19232/g.40392 Transcript_19232/m.40392 type:complete len:169 (+) Transcript_19232:104-610(+)|eukprot:CAMPEP_0171344584 /NCGR_PEP_ID=MMETSP0878-20121228/19710_1 /TAXON_ID=67004 /ORGANISM="Thalassiosira weissflogii, Strain CCMP1336" /LENGTH=168 /DNA_ID=CAMNT_0011847807 /DNA_START=60 /DNA_END=566 /DNA_ORIENTATION=+
MMNSFLPHLRRTATATILRRTLATDAAPASGLMKLNFNLPQETLYDGASVKSVIVPGAMGEYEVTADHVPIVAELKAGMLTINHESGEPEKYFVAGGFSLTHEGSTTDIVCPEAVKLDDIDPAAVQKNFEAAKAKASSSESGSADSAEAMIDVEVNRAMGSALGLSLV